MTKSNLVLTVISLAVSLLVGQIFYQIGFNDGWTHADINAVIVSQYVEDLQKLPDVDTVKAQAQTIWYFDAKLGSTLIDQWNSTGLWHRYNTKPQEVWKRYDAPIRIESLPDDAAPADPTNSAGKFLFNNSETLNPNNKYL
jgi:hypothetical protein